VYYFTTDIFCVPKQVSVPFNYAVLERITGKYFHENCENWSGDGRYDSMGHCAKYGTYTMFNNGTGKLVHFEILQVLILLIYKTSFSLQYI